MRRAKGQGIIGFGPGHQHLPLGGSLIRMAQLVLHDKQPPHKPAIKRHYTKTKVTDDDVREMRRLHEQDGLPAKAIAERYGLTIEYTRQVLQYETRIKFIF